MLLKMPVEGGRSVYVNVDNLMVVAVKEVSENSIRVVFHFSNEKSFQYTLPMSLSEFEEALSLATSIYDVSKKEFVAAPELQPSLYPPFLPQPEAVDFSFLVTEEPMTEAETAEPEAEETGEDEQTEVMFPTNPQETPQA
jgi:predicted Zn-dependent protease